MVRRLILSRTVALTVIGGSRPRGLGTQAGFAMGVIGVSFLVVPLVFTGTGGTATGAEGIAMEVTPAQVDGGVGDGIKRSTSFSARNMLLKFKTCRPVLTSSRTVGGPSIIVIRQRSS